LKLIPIQPTYPESDLSGYYCLSPFISIHIDHYGSVSLCPCPGWASATIGNILTTSLKELLSSQLAQEIRQSIIDGSYRFCKKDQCAVIINQDLNTTDNLPPNVKKLITDSALYEMPYEIMLHGDRTCNLSCPSCRTSILKLDNEEIEKQKEVSKILFTNLFPEPSSNPIYLCTSGSGELFGSTLLLDLLGQINLKDFPNFKIGIHTNGLLSEKNWYKIQHLEPAIRNLTISIDAATNNTYTRIRRGGTWEKLLSSMDFLKSKKQKLKFKFITRMIVQQQNYNEALDFYNFCKLYDVDEIQYSRLSNWQTWPLNEFRQHDVFDINHPERDQARKMMADIKQLPNTWFEGNFK
jgi:pyruvate-formate lyase-activating enzyme